MDLFFNFDIYIYMARPFRTSTPHLYNTEYIRNKKSKVMYNHMVNVAVNNKCSSSDGKTKIDCSGYLLHTNNQETLNLLRYGSALCAPCDISGLVTEPGDISGVLDKCPCLIPMTNQMRTALYHIVKDHLMQCGTGAGGTMDVFYKFGLGPDFIRLPWNPFERPGAHNANKTFWTPYCNQWDSNGQRCKPGCPTRKHGKPPPSETDPYYNQKCELRADRRPLFTIPAAPLGGFSSCPFNMDHWVGSGGASQDVLPYMFADASDCSGSICGTSLVGIYGGHMTITNTDLSFINYCGSTYLPQGTFAFSMRTLISTWLYLWEPISAMAGPTSMGGLELLISLLHERGIYAARPPTTIDNYLNDFAQNTPLRFYRSKYWHTHA